MTAPQLWPTRMSKWRLVEWVTALKSGVMSALVPSSVPPSAGMRMTRRGFVLVPCGVFWARARARVRDRMRVRRFIFRRMIFNGWVV
jgi:hypothetical protein